MFGEANLVEFKAAVIARCFIVGFRIFRQSATNKARLAYAMSNAVQKDVFGTVEDLGDFHPENMHKLFTEIASAHSVAYPENWAARVLLLSSTLFMSSATICVAADIEVSAESKEAIVCNFEKSIQTMADLIRHDEDGTITYYAHLISLAVSGNVRLSTTFNTYFPGRVKVYDEDICSVYRVPELPARLHNWMSTLEIYRGEQFRNILAQEEAISANMLQDEEPAEATRPVASAYAPNMLYEEVEEEQHVEIASQEDENDDTDL